ncbi:hypothetical protein EAH87_10420 [Sphingomonas koreensis]|nr:hypothetical protein EAH87_10420 [Sphingomonas koreensis]
MSAAPAFLAAPAIMALVATAAAIAATYVVTRPARSEQAVYAGRLIATMLAALAVILGAFSFALGSWGPGR